MRRRPAIVSFVVLVVAVTAQQHSQTGPEAYQTWRVNHPAIERDAPMAGSRVGARIEKSAVDQAKYAGAHRSDVESMRADMMRQVQLLAGLALAPKYRDASDPAEEVLTVLLAATSAGVGAVELDKDAGLQPLKKALQGELNVLTVLSEAIRDRHRAHDAAAQAALSGEEARDRLQKLYASLGSGLNQEAEQTASRQIAWTEYYRLLNQGVRVLSPGEAAPQGASSITSAASRSSGAGGASAPAPAATRGVSPVPLSRYVGAWSYFTVTPVFRGYEPEVVELKVRESDGQMSGDLSVRFKASAGAPADRMVRFDFSGVVQAARSQTFPLQTSDGRKGTFELIPGQAFNLLEVKFAIEDKPGTITSGNFVVLKK